ncbi:MAG: hypothetical protein HQL50_01845 [Magnetococcales bacterium]|nr:hypothetical protein [Magnetococcales bacterium]
MRSQRGSLLISAIILLVMGGIVTAAMVKMSEVNTSTTVENYQAAKAFNLAEGGIKWAVGSVQAVGCDLSQLDSSDGTFTTSGGSSAGSGDSGDSGGSGTVTNPNNDGDSFSFSQVTSADGTFQVDTTVVSDSFLFEATGSASGNTRSIEQTYTFDDLCNSSTSASPTGWKESL